MSKITDEMVEAGAKTVWSQGTRGLHERKQHIRNILEAAFAALPAIEGQGEVKVKPMEWAFSPDGSYRHCAETITGIYWISQNGPDEFYLERDITSIGGWRKSLDEAKAAAQADYERRILSAITHPVPARESENARQEAVDAFIARLDGLVRKNEEAYAAAVADFRAAFRAAFRANHTLSEET